MQQLYPDGHFHLDALVHAVHKFMYQSLLQDAIVLP
jgi:hypothetical protein